MLKYWSLDWTDAGSAHMGHSHDCVVSFVIAASTEAVARQLASEDCGDEGPEFWLNPLMTTCEPYELPKETGIAFRDFHSA